MAMAMSSLRRGALLRSSPSLLFRAMATKLFIGGLSWGVDDISLKGAFEQYGQLTEAKVIYDRETGRSRGFAFVSYATDEEAKAARDGMDGQELNGRTIRVDFASDRPLGGGTRNFNTFKDVIN